MTVSPAVLVTGIDSPVTSDSSSEERPSSTVPSTGTFSPGRTRSRSPTCDQVEGDLLLGAVGVRCGARSSGSGRAGPGWHPEVCSRARSSRTWPSRTRTVMTAAASKYTSTVPSIRNDVGEDARRDGGDDAEQPRDTGAHRDQGEHVQLHRPRPRPSRGRRTASRAHSTTGVASDQLDPGRGRRRRRGRRAPGTGRRPSPARPPGSVRATTDPEPAGHVRQLRARTGVRASPSPAPAPSRRSGRRPDPAGGSAGASGRCTRQPRHRRAHRRPAGPRPSRGPGPSRALLSATRPGASRGWPYLRHTPWGYLVKGRRSPGHLVSSGPFTVATPEELCAPRPPDLPRRPRRPPVRSSPCSRRHC